MFLSKNALIRNDSGQFAKENNELLTVYKYPVFRICMNTTTGPKLSVDKAVSDPLKDFSTRFTRKLI